MEDIKNTEEVIVDEPIVQEEVVDVDKDDEVETVVEDSDKDDKEHTDEKTYTQTDVDALLAQIDELSKYKPQEKSEQEVKLEEKEKELWSKEVSFTLKEEGLDVFAEFIQADVNDKDSLVRQITKLKEIVSQLELSNTYQPTNHKQVDGYSIDKKNKDVASMIKNKLNF